MVAEWKSKWRTDYQISDYKTKWRTLKQDDRLEKNDGLENKMADWRTRWLVGEQDDRLENKMAEWRTRWWT